MARPRLFVFTAGMQRETWGNQRHCYEPPLEDLPKVGRAGNGMQLCQAKCPAGAASSTPYSAGVVSSAVASRDVVM